MVLSDSTVVDKNPSPKAAQTNNHYLPQLHLPVINEKSDPILVTGHLTDDSTQYYRSKAEAYKADVLRRNALVGNLNELHSVQLPVALGQNDNTNYAVIISEISGDRNGALLEAYFLFEIPQTGDKIAFRGKNIGFSHDGALTGVGRMELIGNYPIKLNEKTLVTILGKGNTFVEFDCEGFKSMGIEAEIEFSRDLIIPEDENGKQKPAPERVKTKFQTIAQYWNDLLVGVQLPAFQVNGLKDVSFSVRDGFLDWSDLANPSGIIFPPGYTSPYQDAGKPSMWQGFFLQRLDVKLPAAFANRESNERVTLGVENMILDDQGLSGTIFAENILSTGDMSGWAYTIDKVGLEMVINKVKGFEIEGKVAIPRIKKKDNETTPMFSYVAHQAADGNYIFAVKIEDDLRLPFLIADLHLYPGSSVIVKEEENNFYPTAILNGDMSIQSSGNGIRANLFKIRFEGMVISSEEPRFDIQSIGFGNTDTQDIAGFPIVIKNISVKKPETEKLGLNFDLIVNIGGKPEEEGFGGTATLTVWGKHDQQPIKNTEGNLIGSEKDNWKFDKIELSGVGIHIRKPQVYELAGTINFFDADPIYGQGFKGTLSGAISKFAGLQADALFGKTKTFRYWYADALVSLKTGVPLLPGVLYATGFGGGFYSKMKQSTQHSASPLGKTQSGIYYVPDENTLGIRAIMNIGTARPEAVNGDVGLEVVMNRHGGINSVTFSGNANFMSFKAMDVGKIKELASSAVEGKLSEKLAGLAKGQVYGNIRLEFDNVNDVFHGNLEVYVNVAGGLVRGVNSDNKAGWAVLHFEKSDWYVLIGTPDQPIGLEVARLFKSKSYFMLGKNLPGSPPPPSQVSEILGHVDLDYMRDFNALESGMGFAFGLHFLVDTGDLKFLMFYGRFAAGTGVDFMLKDYGENYHCEGSTGAFGINGWYANGQAYAFVMGKIGIKVNLRFYKGSYEILSIGAAAILQAKGPNPFWMKGIVGGQYRILGGLVKGRCKFEITVGKDCKPVGEQNILEDVNMIAGITPANNSTMVNVFNTPQVAFNIPVNEIFEITDLEGRNHSFRATLDEFIIMNGTKKINGTLQWNTDHDVVVFDADEILPGQQKLKARARLTFEERISGSWTKVKFEGKVVEEIAASDFETDAAPDFIPSNNIALSYPLIEQFNFYPEEYGNGFIQLKDGQAYLFKPGEQWVQKIRWVSIFENSSVESELAYNQAERKITFKIPPGLANESVYDLRIVNTPKTNAIIDANVQRIETELATSEKGLATLSTKTLEGQVMKLEEKAIYEMKFRTSKYKTFIEKLKNTRLSPTIRIAAGINLFQLTSTMSGEECFDEVEITGLPELRPLITMEAMLKTNYWYEQYAYPLVYEGYPLLSRMRVGRANPELLGIPPVRDMSIENVTRHSFQTTGSNPIFSPFTDEYIVYNLAISVASDYRDIQHQAVNYIIANPAMLTKRLEDLIIKPVPYIRYGQYRFKIMYTIPGSATPNSSYEFQLFNSIRDNE